MTTPPDASPSTEPPRAGFLACQEDVNFMRLILKNVSGVQGHWRHCQTERDLDAVEILVGMPPGSDLDASSTYAQLWTRASDCTVPLIPLEREAGSGALEFRLGGQPPILLDTRRPQEIAADIQQRIQASIVAQESNTMEIELGTQPPHQEELLLGRYRVLSLLGKGGMANVHLCWDEQTRLKVAIKRLHPHLGSSPELQENIRKNFRLVQGLNHPAIANHKHVEVLPADTMLVMEYVPGISLQEWMHRTKGNQSLEQVVDLLRPVAQALDYAHAQNIIHRDIKPSNIQVLIKDSDVYVKVREVVEGELQPTFEAGVDVESKLLDFGIATPFHSTIHVDPTLESPRPISGTLPYMAPEQISGHHQDAATDQYAFAASLYHCLAGHPPIPIDPRVPFNEAVRVRIQTEPVAGIEALSEEANAAFQQALSKNRKERFTTCEAFLDALCPPPTPEPNPVRPSRLWMALIPLLLLAAFLSWYAGWGQAGDRVSLQYRALLVDPDSTPATLELAALLDEQFHMQVDVLDQEQATETQLIQSLDRSLAAKPDALLLYVSTGMTQQAGVALAPLVRDALSLAQVRNLLVIHPGAEPKNWIPLPPTESARDSARTLRLSRQWLHANAREVARWLQSGDGQRDLSLTDLLDSARVTGRLTVHPAFSGDFVFDGREKTGEPLTETASLFQTSEPEDILHVHGLGFTNMANKLAAEQSNIPPEIRVEIAQDRDPRSVLLNQLEAIRKRQGPHKPDPRFARPRVVCLWLDEVPKAHTAWVAGFRGGLLESPHVRLVNRELLESMLKELQLGSGDLSEASSRLALGKILPASIFIKVEWLPPDKLALDAFQTETTQSRVSEVISEIDPAQSQKQAAAFVEALYRDMPLSGGILRQTDAGLLVGIGTFQGLQKNQKLSLIQRTAIDGPFKDVSEKILGHFPIRQLNLMSCEIELDENLKLPADLSTLVVREQVAP